jgi:putative transposase
MILARQLKLKVTQEQHKVLLETLDQYKGCVDKVFEHGFKNHLTSGRALHDATYYDLRAKYPQLPSALVCAARVRATEALKAIKTRTKGKWDTEQPKAGRYPSIRYNSTCCAIGKDTFAIATTQGRIKLAIVTNPFVKEDIFSTTCEVAYKKYCNTWFLTVYVEVKEEQPLPTNNVLGIDRGIKHIAVCSNNQFFNSKHLRNIKGKYRYLRQKLQSKGTHSAKRLLRKLSGRENRFQKDTNHCISKQLVALPFDTFVLEDLQIKSNTGKGRAFNTLIANWSWDQLEQFLTYKAILVGKKVVYVDARYTSQKCSVCGYVYRGNRKTQSDFCCMRCGFQCNADLNASRNIRNNYIAMLGISSHGRVESITQTPRPNRKRFLVDGKSPSKRAEIIDVRLTT